MKDESWALVQRDFVEPLRCFGPAFLGGTSSPSLTCVSGESWWLKHGRAEDHVRSLVAEVAAAFEQAPAAEVTALSESSSATSFRVQKLLLPMPSWPSIVGDVVHNLRSALDHVAFALVKGGRNAPTRQTMFPVTKSVANFAKTARTSLSGLSSATLAAIERRQPYHEGCLELAVIHGLDVIDKHREIHIMAPLLRPEDNPRGSEHELQDISDMTFQSELVIALDNPDLDLYGPVRETFDFVAPAIPLLRQLLDWTAETLETLDVFATPRSGQDH